MRWWSPWTIVAAGALLRAIVVTRTYEPAEVWRGDPRTYADILEAVLAGRIDPAMWVWPPGFPITAIPFRMFLSSAAALHSVAWIAGVATIALLITGGQRVRAALPLGAAAFVVAFFPEAVLAAARPLPATIAILGSVGAAIGIEAACRGGRSYWAAVGGFAGAIAILSRPETALSIPLYAVISFVARRRAWKPVLLYSSVVAVILTPYALAFRSATGAWGISIKPHLNVLKLEVYEGGADFGERRALWDAFLDRFSDAEGRLDPRQVVEAADPAAYFWSPAVLGTMGSNFAYAFRRDPVWVNLLWIVGIAGLAFGRSPRRHRWLALAVAAPVVSVATLFPPVERYALVTLPALGFGVGCFVERFRALVPRLPRPTWAIALAAVATLGAVESVRQSGDYHWRGRYGEFVAAHSQGNDVEAEAILREAMFVDPSNPEPHERLGTLRQEHGDIEGAARAFRAAADLGGSPVSLAALYLRTGRREEAEALLAPLRSSPPARADYWSVVGHIAMMNRDWLRAANCFARSEALGGPKDLLALNRGMALLRAGQVREGVELLRRATESPNPAVREAATTELARLSRPPAQSP